MAAAAESPAWKTAMVDSFGLMFVVWAIPVAIVVVGAPIVLVVRLLLSLTGQL
ncbi:MAG TPA: hypothetical protein VNT81_02290 [Vicinamibacterales bacterium]|nr:hypothetical protein [Vicinamibacterales bacterium]